MTLNSNNIDRWYKSHVQSRRGGNMKGDFLYIYYE